MTTPPGTSPAKGGVGGPSLALLAGISAIGPAALTLFVPALPAIGQSFAVSADKVQWTLTLYFLGISFGQLFYGPLSDRFGRRPVLIGGLLIYAAASLMGFAAASIEMLIAARALQALGGCSGMVTVRAMIQDSYSGDRVATALSSVLMAAAIAPMVAPLLGGYLVEWLGWRAGFLVLTAAALLLIGLCWNRLGETQTTARPVLNGWQLAGLYGELFKKPTFLILTFGTAMLPSTHLAFMSGAPHYAIGVMGCSPSTYGYFAMALPAGFIAGNFITTRITSRLGGLRMIWLGLSICAVGLSGALTLTTLEPTNPWHLFMPMILVTMGHGIGMSNLVALTLRQAGGNAGTAVAAVGATQMGMAAIMSQIVGHLLHQPVTVMLLVLMTIHGTAIVLVLVGQRRLNR